MWTDDDKTAGYCYYRIVVMQADGSPSTLRDGMVVSIGLKTTFGGDMSTFSQCKARAATFQNVQAMDAVKSGNAVEIDAVLDTRGKSGPREIDLYFGSITDKGVAPMMPVPVTADPNDFVPAASGQPLPQKFFDSNGVLVKFDNVKVNSRDTTYQDFKASTVDTGGAFIATNYLRVIDRNYMSPPDKTALMYVIGIVLPDFSGRIWARTTADIKK